MGSDEELRARVVGLTHAVRELAAAMDLLAVTPEAADHVARARLNLEAAEILARDAATVTPPRHP